jgi:hypothetical protein
MLPTPEVGTLELCLAISRDQQHQSAVLRRSFQDNAFKIKATLRKHPTMEGMYLACLHVPTDSRVAPANSRLEYFARVRVLLKLAGHAAIHQLSGIVVDGARSTRSEVMQLMLVVDEPDTDLDKHSPAEDLTTAEFLASVECTGDPTPTRRWTAAIRAINKDRSHTKGLDIKHLVLQSPPTLLNTGSMASEVEADLQCKVIIERIVEERQLEDTHIDAVNLACTTREGLAVIGGLPGIGKTRVLGAIGEIQVEIGKQIESRRCGLAVAPSNLDVEQLAKSIIGTNPQNMECVWYMGSCWGNEEGDLEAAMHPLWHLVEEAATSSAGSALFGIGFHKKRLAAFRRWIATPGHPMAITAQEYLNLRTKVQAAEAAEQTHETSYKEDNDSLHDLDYECSSYYLNKEVDMVFCTNATSAQRFLSMFYQPAFILQDNAAEINVPEAATPIAAFVQTVELLVLAGDRTHQRPTPASQGFNELLGVLLKSPMDLVSVNSLFERSCIDL